MRQPSFLLPNGGFAVDTRETAWNWGGKAGLFYAGTNLLCNVWCYFRLPETKDRSFGEIDLLFENKISARKFKSTKVDRESRLRHVWLISVQVY